MPSRRLAFLVCLSSGQAWHGWGPVRRAPGLPLGGGRSEGLWLCCPPLPPGLLHRVCVCVSDRVVITPVMPTCSSLPTSDTFAVDPGVGACLLTSPEVTRRAVTHSAPASTCPCSRPKPPSLQRGEGTGQPVLGAWVLLALGPRLRLPSGRWVAAPTSGSPLEACSCSSPATHTDPGKRQFISVMRFPHHPCCGGSA